MILYEFRLTHGRWRKNRGRTAAKWCSGPADLHGKRVKILTRFILRSSTRRALERSERKNLHTRRPVSNCPIVGSAEAAAVLARHREKSRPTARVINAVNLLQFDPATGTLDPESFPALSTATLLRLPRFPCLLFLYLLLPPPSRPLFQRVCCRPGRRVGK